MALGFIKKIFSFGKDTVPEADRSADPAEAPRADETTIPAGHPPEAPSVERDELLEEAEAANPDPGHPPAQAEPDIYPLPHDRVTLPVTEDPVIEPEVETGGGPAPDADETADEPETSPGIASETPSFTPSGHLPADEEDREEDAGPIPEDEGKARPAIDENTEIADEAVEVEHDLAPDPVFPLEEEMPGGAEKDQTSEDIDAADHQPAASPVLPKGFSTVDRSRSEEPAPPATPRRTWFQRLREGLSRTSSQLTGQIASLFTKRKLDDATLQDLEDLLIQADLGVETALRITDTLASERYGKDVTGSDVSRIMAGEITKVLAPVAKPLELDLSHKPHVILVVGVNGTGKTTTIGKLAAKLSTAGLKVMMAAGDTFRAAAIEQLKIWAERTGSGIVASKLGADAAGLAYEAYEQAKLKKSDVLIIDTAGRLQNKAELMAELEKIVRVLGKLDPDAPHTVLQTLDATTGQNAMNQVEIFRNVAGVSGLIMTKLDGTARGGILVAIAAKHKLPVYFIGVGEGIEDLEPFEAKDFAQAIAGVQE
ncbi:MAG: signal recognition particle-docking protein FtsY [Shinella sp.]|nr:signal recognition particle-docking protein FtsY [Shinella sp.]